MGSGCGFWTLIIPDFVCRILALPFLFRHVRWLPSFSFRWRDLEQIRSFSSKSVVSFWIATANTNLDYAILGRFFSDGMFGLYFFAYKRIREPMRTGVASVRGALFPAMSKAQTDESLRKSLLQTIRLLVVVVYPMATCLFVISPQLIPFVYGDEWVDAVPLMQAFTIWGLFIPLTLVFSSAFMSKSIFRPTHIEGVGRAILIGVGLWVLCLNGATIYDCAVWVVVVESVGNLALVYSGLKNFDISLGTIFSSLYVPFFGLVLAGVCDELWGEFRGETTGLKAGACILGRVTQILLICASVSWLLDRKMTFELMEIAKRLVIKRGDSLKDRGQNATKRQARGAENA